MTITIKRRALAALTIAVCGLALGGATAEAATEWRLQAAPNANLWMDAPGAFPTLGRSIGSGAHAPSQWWTFRRVGGTVQYPWYKLVNRTGRCLYFAGIDGPEGPGPYPADARCYSDSFTLNWFQFRTLTNQPVNPGLSAGGTGAVRTYRIHWMGQPDMPSGTHCLVVPYSYFKPATRLGIQQCSNAANQQWRLYPSYRR